MKNRILLLIIIVLSVVFINQKRSIKDTSFLSNKINVKDSKTSEKSTLDIEEYVIGVVAGEMPASFESEALKAQAVAARTYAYYKIKTSSQDYSITNDTTSQVYITKDEMNSKWGEEYEYYYNKIADAVNATKDIIITYNDNIISSYYFSMSNGYTESALNVFNEDKPYLISKVSIENTSLNNYEYNQVIDRNEFCNKLDISCEEIVINNVEKDESNHVKTIVINNKIFAGTDIRKLLSLRSTDFSFLINSSNIEITTYGYGHGVGMSQYGANELAKSGASFEEILEYYYDNTKLNNINSII